MTAPVALAAALAALAVGLALDAVAGPSRARGWRAPALRLLAHAALLGGLFCLTLFRPISSIILYLVAVATLVAASRGKRRILRERLVVHDLLLIRQILRHPRMYYTSKRDWRVWAIAAGTLAALGAIALEPPLSAAAGLSVFCAFAAALALLTTLGASPATCAQDAAGEADRAIAEAGLLGSLYAGALALRTAPDAPPRAPAPLADAQALIVAVQCESFLSGERFAGGPALPAFAALRARARSSGRLETPAYGANTMRAEFSFLSGLPNARLGALRFNPYLASAALGPGALTRGLRDAGWRTIFVHPNDARFFDRDRVVPDLGFERFVDGADFARASRAGPYVSDAEVAKKVLALAAQTPRPALIFAATMENHGPWRAGRLGPGKTGLDCFKEHLVNADRMIGALCEGLARLPGPVVLCVFGDHLPALDLPGVDDLLATDYALARLDEPPEPGRAERRTERRMRIEDLLAAAVACAAARPAD